MVPSGYCVFHYCAPYADGMDTLSSAVAEVVRRELAGRQIDAADFAKTVGMPKTTVWRKINGTSKMSIDDVAAFAGGLGWTLPELMVRAQVLQKAGPMPPLDPALGKFLTPAQRAELERIRVENHPEPPAAKKRRGRKAAG